MIHAAWLFIAFGLGFCLGAGAFGIWLLRGWDGQ
jgi:hypothetical protein